MPPASERTAHLERLERFIEVLTVLEVAPRSVQAFDPAHPRIDATRPLLVLRPEFEAARPLVAARYPSGHGARAVLRGSAGEATLEALPAEAEAWWIAPLASTEDLRTLEGLRAVIEHLYGPEGCPWDREQTHETLRKYLLEESYELVDAIDRGSMDGLREELGDLTAHLFMQAAIAQEAGEFTLEEVVEGAARKMIRRHPHVFGDEGGGSSEWLLGRWEELKAEERAASALEDEPRGVLDSVPRAAPALQRAQSLQQRGVRAGALEPELAPLQSVARAVGALGPRPDRQRLGELLWATVRLARALDLDAEEALRLAADGFTSRFAALEASTGESEGIEAAAREARASIWPGAQ